MGHCKHPIANDSSILAQVRSNLLFHSFSDEQFNTIYQQASCTELEEGETLFSQEQPSHEFFLLTSGQIKLCRCSTEGNEKIIDLISPGSSFGEAIMFAKQPVYPVSAMALLPSQIICFNSNVYLDTLHQSTEACFSIMAQMSRRLHWQIGEIDRLTLHTAMFRVVAYLIDQLPSTQIGASQIQLQTPKNVIAARLSITPETLSRSFAKLNREGLISIHDDSVTLIDIDRLKLFVKGGTL
ncbi:MAG: Crp/Fnr family transcriptional regulator [Gammaproteobacteria bacterium]